MKNDDWFDDSCSGCGDFNYKESSVPGLCKACEDETKIEDKERMI